MYDLCVKVCKKNYELEKIFWLIKIMLNFLKMTMKESSIDWISLENMSLTLLIVKLVIS